MFGALLRLAAKDVSSYMAFQNKRVLGYSHPRKRNPEKQMKLPNVGIKRDEWELMRMGDGSFSMRKPWPPRTNPTCTQWSLPKVVRKRLSKAGEEPRTRHREYVMSWRGVKYMFTPTLKQKPNMGHRWGGEPVRLSRD